MHLMHFSTLMNNLITTWSNTTVVTPFLRSQRVVVHLHTCIATWGRMSPVILIIRGTSSPNCSEIWETDSRLGRRSRTWKSSMGLAKFRTAASFHDTSPLSAQGVASLEFYCYSLIHAASILRSICHERLPNFSHIVAGRWSFLSEAIALYNPQWWKKNLQSQYLHKTCTKRFAAPHLRIQLLCKRQQNSSRDIKNAQALMATFIRSLQRKIQSL